MLLADAAGWRTRAARDAAMLDRMGGEVVARLDPGYPASLNAIADAPPVLLLRGDRAALEPPAVAIVGARAATRPARRAAREFGRGLAARGFVVVSGLARGIDAEAHRGALDVGGRTVAVLAGGIDRVYPPEHRALADEIADRGAIVGEMPLGTPPRRELFPQRNRVIAGLGLGVLVVEARERSGSLITVRHALAQGREVFTVPGPIDGPFARGNHKLLRDGARAVTTPAELVEDLLVFDHALAVRLEDVRDASRGAGSAAAAGCGGDRPATAVGVEGVEGVEGVDGARVLAALRAGPLDFEALCAASGVAPGVVAARLLDFGLSGRVVEERDGRYAVVGPLDGTREPSLS